jgi:nitronate monooxygenase
MSDSRLEPLGIPGPIIQAPMAGGWTTPALVAAVAEAGGFGNLAGARLTTDQLRAQIREVRSRTARPFGVNFLIPAVPAEDVAGGLDHPLLTRIRARLGLPPPPPPPPTATVDEAVDIAIGARVPVVSFAMGSPAPYVERLKAAGVAVLATATTVAEAEAAAAAGADAIVAQGSEAGGHRSTFTAGRPADIPLVGTMALVPQVVDAVPVPVIAAGGIMDGRGVLAALALGAEAAQLGTRFLLAAESGAPHAYRRRLIEAVETDTVVTDVFSGRAARGLRNAFVDAFAEAGLSPLPWPRQVQAAADIYRASLESDGSWAPLLAGQGLRLARREQSAADIVGELLRAVAAGQRG